MSLLILSEQDTIHYINPRHVIAFRAFTMAFGNDNKTKIWLQNDVTLIVDQPPEEVARLMVELGNH